MAAWLCDELLQRHPGQMLPLPATSSPSRSGLRPSVFLSVFTLPFSKRRATHDMVIVLAGRMDLPTRLETHFVQSLLETTTITMVTKDRLAPVASVHDVGHAHCVAR